MAIKGSPWTETELGLVLNLYFRTPFGRLHTRNPDVIKLADAIGRTHSSVAFKLVNFASLDPELKARGIKGATNVSKLDVAMWNKFYNNLEDSAFESTLEYEKVSDEVLSDWQDKAGIDKTATLKYRINQGYFRKMILASYNNSCCITGLNMPQMLVAAHINRWSSDAANRLNPQNGLCLNLFHDKAFELGLVAISEDYSVLVSSRIKKHYSTKIVEDVFMKYENSRISLPTRSLPSIEYLATHRNERFQG